MKTKIIVLLLIVVFLFVVYWIKNTPTQPPNKESINLPSDVVDEAPTETHIPVEKKNTQPSTHARTRPNNELSADQYDQLMTQIEKRQYSADAGVELISLGMEYESCGNNNWDWRFKSKDLTEKQSQIRASVEIHCQKLQSQYPFLESKTLIKDLGQVFAEFPTETELGRFIKNNFNVKNSARGPSELFPRGLIAHGIQAENSQIVKMAGWMTKFRSNQFVFDQNLIKGQDFMYLHQLQSVAITAVSCEFQKGKTCDPTSSFMQEKCFESDQFCGMGFNDWYALAVLPGMDADVQLLKQHLRHLPTP